MARINLLPWREDLKRERQKNFFILSGLIAVLTLGIIVTVHMEMDANTDHWRITPAFAMSASI